MEFFQMFYEEFRYQDYHNFRGRCSYYLNECHRLRDCDRHCRLTDQTILKDPYRLSTSWSGDHFLFQNQCTNSRVSLTKSNLYQEYFRRILLSLNKIH